MKNKLIKALIPSLVGITTVATPLAICLTSCGDNSNIKVDKKDVTTTDSVATYKFSMKDVPESKVVHVKLVNKDTTKQLDKVVLYTSESSNSNYITEADVTVDDNGNFTLPIGLVLAGAESSTSPFDLQLSYEKGDEIISQDIKDCNLNYNLVYSGDIKDGNYDPTSKYPEGIPAASHWTEGSEGTTYMQDCLAHPDIYNQDARYSTSQRIHNVIQSSSESFNVKSFEATFNDVVEEKDGSGSTTGLHVHMNYKMDGSANDSVFKFVKGDKTYEFTNFNCAFTLETTTGYTFTKLARSQLTDDVKYHIIDTSTEAAKMYNLDGRFKGGFSYKITETGEEAITGTVSNYDGLIGNHDSSNELTDKEMCDMFAAGIIHLTYDFTWETEIPYLTVLSPYSKNATN